MSKGFVYILRNEAFENLLKIGFSTKIPDERAKELSGTGVPSPYVVSYYCLTNKANLIESKVHENLSTFRHSKNREFFEIDIETAVNCIRAHCKPEYEWSNQILLRSKEGVPLNLRELNYEVNGIEICSRRNVESQLHEMVNFCELAHKKELSHLIVSLLYCSNSDCCSFELTDEVEKYSEKAKEIRQVALETIGQFEWYGAVCHGKPLEELF